MPERMGPDRRRLIGTDPQVIDALAGEHVEVIEPEIDHYLVELAPAVECAQHPGLGRLADDDAGGLAARLDFLRRRFAAAARAWRAVLDEQLDRIEAKRLEPGQPLGQDSRLRD